MVASEGPNAFDRRGSYSYDATSSRTLRVYDTGKPETYSTWWATHGQAALDSEGLLFAVLNGPPTYDDAATEAIEREILHGQPDDPRAAAYDIFSEMMDTYRSKNRAAYNMLVRMVIHRSGRMLDVVTAQFSHTRDGHGYLKFLAAEASTYICAHNTS